MNDTIEMVKYYNFRKEIHKLYFNDTINSGDLHCKILEIRDKYRSVESINISLQQFSIYVEMSTGTSLSKKQEVARKIATAIGTYIVNNRNLLDPSIDNDPDFETFINSDNMIFCDIMIVGDSISFNL